MTQEDWDKSKEYLEGYMLDLTYDIVTQKIVLKDLLESDGEVILSYDPFDNGETDQAWLLQDLIDYYIEEEKYERCAKLLKLKVKVERGLLDLSPILYLKDEWFVDNAIIETEESAVKKLIDEVLKNKYNQN